MAFGFGPRRGTYLDVAEHLKTAPGPLAADAVAHFEKLDLVYRSTCALLYNYVPMSGHPGGSISCGRILAMLLFDSMSYDLSQPSRDDADLISFAAGHKAMGLYGMWAIRDEIARIGAPSLLPSSVRFRLRLEDLLGFRRNPITKTPLFTSFGAKALDGHPTPVTPFIWLSTGASGVGVSSSLGLAFGAKDYYGAQAPRVNIVEGEGGLTPGRVAEALAATGTGSVGNAILHHDLRIRFLFDQHCLHFGGERKIIHRSLGFRGGLEVLQAQTVGNEFHSIVRRVLPNMDDKVVQSRIRRVNPIEVATPLSPFFVNLLQKAHGLFS